MLLAPLLLLAIGGPPAPQPITIRFAGMVGDQPFSCGTSYAGVGTKATTITATDFRFFVSGVRLLTADGAEVPLALEQDQLWQQGDVALIDFENGTGGCANGTPQTRQEIRGTAPAGTYTGVKFTLGLPFDVNHRDVTAQASPLNVTSLFWSWRGGYKFLRLDLKVDSPVERLFLHIGSTGCTPDGGPATAAPTQCAHRNTATVTLDRFDPTTGVIVTDVAAMLAETDLTVNQEKTAKGCMSAPDDRDCAPTFRALGIPFGGDVPTTQRVFRAETAALGMR